MTAMVTSALYVRTMRVLGLSHKGAAELLGISPRTSQRWITGGGTIEPARLHTLAVAVHPKDPELAAELAYLGRTTLEALGLVAQPGAEAAQAPRLQAEDVIDSVVCAASEAIGVMPAAVRPGLLAACQRARKLGLDLPAMEAALLAVTGKN
jgi:DNA-binding transcriptional regulator YdaS (Cro superfamily)